MIVIIDDLNRLIKETKISWYCKAGFLATSLPGFVYMPGMLRFIDKTYRSGDVAGKR